MIEIDTLSFEDQRWHNFLQKFEYAGPFSSPELIKSFSLSRGFEVFPLFAICNDTIVAAAFPVLIKTWKNISFRYLNRLILFEAPLYLNNSIGISGLCKILSSVITITKKKALFCEIRNNYPFQLDNILNEFDFIYYPYQNYLIDLQVGEDVLWSRLSSFTRNHIRKSQKKGVFVRELEENELHDAIKLLKKLYKQKKIPFIDETVFFNSYKNLIKNKSIRIIGAFYEKKLIGVRITLNYNKVIFDWYAASDKNYSNFYVNEILVWNTICWGIHNNYKIFDFGGAGLKGQYYGPALVYSCDIIIGGGGTMTREGAVLSKPSFTFFNGKLGQVDLYLSKINKLYLIKSEEDVNNIVYKKYEKPAQHRISDNAFNYVFNFIVDYYNSLRK